MGYSFTDLGAEGCCLSQNTLLSLSFDRKVMGYYGMVDADVMSWIQQMNIPHQATNSDNVDFNH